MIKPRVLITEQFHPILTQLLTDAGADIDCFPDIDTQGVKQIIEPYHALVVNSKIQVNSDLLSRAPNLRSIARVGAGMEVIDLQYCHNHQIEVVSAPEGNRNAVAEYVIGWLLSTLRHQPRAQSQLIEGQWIRVPNRGQELSSLTIGIIGYGHTGQQLAHRLQGFDTRIIAHDVAPRIPLYPNVTIGTLQQIYDHADIVSLHLPLDSSTAHLADATFFDSFAKPFTFVNTSRGGICHTQDLIHALYDGRVIQAMLDVHESEPLSITPEMAQLVQQHRLYLTPHIAGWTHQSYYNLAHIAATKLLNTTLFARLSPDTSADRIR